MTQACNHARSRIREHGEISTAMREAETRVADRGSKWTEPRKRVYELLVQAGTPVKAYDLMEAYATDRTAKPPTVYRALDFLEQAGLVHRIASLNAFVACDSAGGAAHAAAFLICDCCGSAQEFDPGELRAATSAAKTDGFTPRAITLEVRGCCASCA